MNGIGEAFAASRLALASGVAWQVFQHQLRHPEKTQANVLRSIMRRNRDTVYGRAHGFTDIVHPREFAARLPIVDYEDLRPYIERQEKLRTPELTHDAPVLYARTSGSTGTPKDIPVLASTIQRHHRSQRLFAYCHSRAIPGLYAGRTLAFVGAAIEGHLAGGTPFGAMSGLVHTSMPASLRNKYILPTSVFSCADHDFKYLVSAVLAVGARDISCIGTANPSTLLKFAAVVRHHWDSIIEAISSGHLPNSELAGRELSADLKTRLRPDPGRAHELRRLGPPALQDSRGVFGRIWPWLKGVVCWRAGNCRLLLPALQSDLPPGIPILELGYLSSEFRGTLPASPHHNRHVPTLQDHFFEFIPRDEWDAGKRTTRLLCDLESGRHYHVIVTAANGLFRYFMNDIVEVDGAHGPTPTLRFVEKGSGTTNITGEKLHENHVCSAMTSLRSDPGLFFVVVAEPESMRYTLYLETNSIDATFAERFDTQLGRLNLEYQSKRASGRLNPIAARSLRPGTADAYRVHLLKCGQREAQLKQAHLGTRAQLRFDFEAHVTDAP